MRLQSETVRANRRQALLKNSVKWNLGALVSGTLFIMIWHMTRAHENQALATGELLMENC